jgi:multiple sugar transport system permease protein
MLLAVLLRSAVKPLRSIVGGLVVLAWVLPEIVAAFALYAFFSKDGTLNVMLGWVGLGHTREAPPGVGSVDLCRLGQLGRHFGECRVVHHHRERRAPPDVGEDDGEHGEVVEPGGAAEADPAEHHEAAEIDGANAWRRFTRVTLPFIRRSISTNLLLTTLQTLGVFTLIWVMTGGGPGIQSSTLPVLAYQEAFKFAQVGYGTAIAVVTLLIGAVFSIA